MGGIDWSKQGEAALAQGLQANDAEAWRELDRRYSGRYLRWACDGFDSRLGPDLRDYAPGFVFERIKGY